MGKARTKKRRSVSSAKAACWKVFSRYIRLRDCLRTTGSLEYGECLTCNETLEFNQLQAGHFIPGRHNANLFSERGVHSQCRACNILRHGEPLEYRRQVIILYGEGADLELEAEAKETKKFTVQELDDLRKHYEEKVVELEGKNVYGI